ncbi:MAG: caspase family protein, partial [Planctomycetota bacterium]
MADKALLMGINAYKSISTLRGCVNDVNNMRRLLTEQYDFDEKNVRVLTDQQVTKSRARREMAWLMQGAKPGDRLVFHFAGHGSYTVDLDGEEDADGRDELICLYDMDWDNTDSYFTDDELRAWTQKLPDGARLTVLLDNCHSGTGTRQIVTRGLESDEVELPWVDLRATLARGQATLGGTRSAGIPTSGSEMEAALGDQVIARFVEPPPEIVAAAANLPAKRDLIRSAEDEMNHILLAACRSDQTAADARIGSDYNGAFTYHLCEAARDLCDEYTVGRV